MKKTITRSLLCVMLLLIVSAAVSVTTMIIYADTYYTLRVEYRFTDDSTAHDPYVAVLAAGTDVDITVTNPALPGYKPALSKEPSPDDPAELTTRLNYQDLSANDTVIVYYVPDLVNYRVHYFKQNIRDDLYTEDLSLDVSYYEKTGYTGEYPTELENIKFEGFTMLFHEPDFIAADGSTQFKIYYDRNYYLINFDLNGGYGVEPVYGKFESVYNIPEPTRKGWVFEGWVLADKNGNYINEQGEPLSDSQALAAARKFTSGVIPAKNVTYKACWSPDKARYTIVYWTENADNSDYTDVASLEVYKYKNGDDVISGQVIDIEDSNMIPNFFSYNLNPQAVERDANGKIILDPDLRPIYITNDNNEPIDDKGNVIDFPEMSPGEREELNGMARYFEIDTEKSDQTMEVNGDGSTRFNVYYKRKEITQRFFFARKTSNGKYEVPGLTKAFSSSDGTFDQHLGSSWGGSTNWQELSDDRPQIAAKYADKLEVKEYYSAPNNATYYYYELKTKYYANMRSNWLDDAFDPLLITKGNYSQCENDCALFGAWSVEWGTPYAKKSNKTVKGIYEKLDKQLLYTEEYLKKNYIDDPTVLNYLSFWANAKNAGWNKKATFYNFTYKNYVEILPKEYTADKSDWNHTGGYTEVYKDSVTGKIYGLLPENIIETYDGGTQYDEEVRTGRYKSRDEAVKKNQTAAALTGFALLTDEEIEASGLTQNPMCDWYANENFDANHHADVKYFYRRRYYSLIFLNNGEREPAEKTRNIYYQMDINSVGIRGNWVYFEPQYPDENLRDYYYFDGWYFDQAYTSKIPIEENSPAYNGRTHFNSDFKMPPDDVTVYAKWNLVTQNISFYHDYNELVAEAEPIHTCVVEYNDFILTKDVPSNEHTPGVPYLETPEHSDFAGWYYINEINTPVRFDPDSMPVIRDMKLYAHWSFDDTAKYQITYVEKGTGKEVAPPISGTAFVHQTKSFNAKTGTQLYEEYQTSGEALWRPTASSHSFIMDYNASGEEFAPNTYQFEYFQKPNVWYRVRYIDSQTYNELIPSKEVNTPLAIVTEAAEYIEGYISDSVNKYTVLMASTNENAEAAKEEELAANTITFLYTSNDKNVLYLIDHYIINTDGTDYELYREDTRTAELHTTLNLGEVFDENETAQSLIAGGYLFESDKTTVNGELVHAETQEVDENQLIISFYYARNKYAYKVQYIDYEDNAVLNTIIYNSDEQLEPVGKNITITPDEHFDYYPAEGAEPISYTRISDRTLEMTIYPDDNQNPAVNVIKVYYYKDTHRALRFAVSCDHETYGDHYGDVSDSLLIVENQTEIRPVTAILRTLENRVYTFIGWYNVPHPTESDEPLTSKYEFTPSMPGADMTYYAVFHQEQVTMDMEIMYNDTGVYDSTASEDTDGSVTGHTVHFTAPENYTSGSETPMNKAENFIAEASPKDENVYLYEFAGWYRENSGAFEKLDNITSKQLELPMTESYHYIAMFKKVSEVSCKLTFRFIPRVPNSDTDDDGFNKFVVKKTLSSDEFGSAVTYDADGPKLTAEYILAFAPYESNHGQTLQWSDNYITCGSAGGALCATVTADQKDQKVTVSYRIDPNSEFTSFQTAAGSNRENDPRLEALDVRGKTFNGKYFSYWEIRNDAQEIVARCYEPLFSFRVWENYWIKPVFESDSESAPSPPSDPQITLTKLDDTRNRWTDDEGNPKEDFKSDYLYTDFEVAFEGPDVFNDPTYRAGMVFEVCGKYYDGLDLSQCNYYTDETELKNALKTKTSGNTTYEYTVDEVTKSRTIQLNPISTSDLSTRSRAQYGKAFRNVISTSTGLPTNGNYIFKVYAYLINGDQVTLSNPVYICLHDVAVKDLVGKQDSP